MTISDNTQNIPKWLGLGSPRYTSYPSAHHFSANVNAGQQAEWLAAIPETANISAYIHIPYCKEMCWFCGCHTKLTHRYDPIARYTKLLLKEIGNIRQHVQGRGRLTQVHFGGGSPSLLGAEDLQAILDALAYAFGPGPYDELAIELDPRTTTKENIAAYARAGVTRASVGIQDFDPEVQQAVNRIQPYEKVSEVVNGLRQAGITHINCDLIYGLPHQTPQKFNVTLEKLLTLNPDRVSLFSYAHMPQLKKHQRLIDTTALPTEKEKLALYRLAGDALAAAGYVAVGIDHYAKADDALSVSMQSGTLRRNFQGYVTDRCDVLVGFGSSAISAFGQGYVQNLVDTRAYSERVEAGELAGAKGWAFTGDDIIRKRIIDDLMCFMQVDLAQVTQEFSLPQDYFAKELSVLLALQEQGVIACEGQKVSIITPYRMAARVVAAVFDRYLDAKLSYSKVA